MENDILGGFTGIFGDGDSPTSSNTDIHSRTISDIENLDIPELDEIDRTFNPHAGTSKLNMEEVEDKQDEDETEDESYNDNDNESDEEEPIATKKQKEKTTTSIDDSFEIEDEALVAKGLYEEIAKKLGIDSDEEFDPTNLDDLVTKLYDIVEENSIPEYANDEVRRIDEYVKNGGDINEYINSIAKFDVSKIDIENEANQKLVIRKLLEHQGYSKEQITKKIDKYDMAGILEDEASDAKEELVGIKDKEQNKLLASQKTANDNAKEAQQKQFDSVVSTIKELNEINGVAVSSKEKRELVKYLFEPTKSGLTQWQEDGKDIKNIVNTAFIMKNGSSLIDSAKKKGKSEAFSKIKEGLRKPKAGNSKTNGLSNGSSNHDDSIRSIAATVNKLFGDPSDINYN